MHDFDEVDCTAEGFGELYDELPLWSAAFRQMLLERIPMKPTLTTLDVGSGHRMAGRTGRARRTWRQNHRRRAMEDRGWIGTISTKWISPDWPHHQP
jgi:hypothetical protein